jgi:hypothetical protein
LQYIPGGNLLQYLNPRGGIIAGPAWPPAGVVYGGVALCDGRVSVGAGGDVGETERGTERSHAVVKVFSIVYAVEDHLYVVQTNK